MKKIESLLDKCFSKKSKIFCKNKSQKKHAIELLNVCIKSEITLISIVTLASNYLSDYFKVNDINQTEYSRINKHINKQLKQIEFKFSGWLDDTEYRKLLGQFINFRMVPEFFDFNLYQDFLKIEDNPNIQDKFGNNFLQNILKDRELVINLSLIKMIVKYGVDINNQNKFGGTALMSVVQMNDMKIVKYLLKQGAKINLVSISGQTALSHAIKCDKTKEKKLIKLLLKNNAKTSDNLEDEKLKLLFDI